MFRIKLLPENSFSEEIKSRVLRAVKVVYCCAYSFTVCVHIVVEKVIR